MARVRWLWLLAFISYTAALWARSGPLFAALGVAVGVGLIALGWVQVRRRGAP